MVSIDPLLGFFQFDSSNRAWKQLFPSESVHTAPFSLTGSRAKLARAAKGEKNRMLAKLAKQNMNFFLRRKKRKGK